MRMLVQSVSPMDFSPLSPASLCNLRCQIASDAGRAMRATKLAVFLPSAGSLAEREGAVGEALSRSEIPSAEGEGWIPWSVVECHCSGS